MKKYDLGFIGAGNMAQAIIKGVAAKFPEISMCASSPEQAHLDIVKPFVSFISDDNNAIAEQSRFLILAVKPNVSKTVLPQIAGSIDADTVIISIMAGVKIETLHKALPQVKSIVRVMPNLGAKVLEAASGIAFYNCSEDSKQFVMDIFNSIGKAIDVKEELMDAVTALSGSGIAYAYYFMDAMIKQSVELGLDYDTARALCVQTFKGAAITAEQGKDTDLQTMIDAVCSKGGTTIQAINTFKNNNVDKIIMDAVMAAYKRAVELSQK